jgi:hypothetical protein
MTVKEAAILLQAFEKPKVQPKKNAGLQTVTYTSMVEGEELAKQYGNHL